MSKSYSVALLDASAIPFPARVSVEGRYAAALERALGGEEGVVATYKAWLEAHECEPGILTAAMTERASRWQRSAEAAQTAGMHGLGHFEGTPHFEVRLERQSEAA